MKIVEILKQNPQLQHHDLKSTIKKVGKYFSYYEEIDNMKEIAEILEVIAFIYYENKLPRMFYILGYERHSSSDKCSSKR